MEIMGEFFKLPMPFFRAMWCRERLDLTVEAFVLRSNSRALFSERELQAARSRLEEVGEPSGPEMCVVGSSQDAHRCVYKVQEAL